MDGKCDGYTNIMEEVVLFNDSPYYRRRHILYNGVLLDVIVNKSNNIAESFIFSEFCGWKELYSIECNLNEFNGFVESVKKLVDAIQEGKK